MPNWVTNKVIAPPHVISAMLNDDGKIDFNMIEKFPGPNTWDDIYGDAEIGAQILLKTPLSDNPLIAALERSNRSDFDIKKLSEESFRQFIGMLENYRACGYLHSMEFAKKAWGTKWNACMSRASVEQGSAQFDTAWTCPLNLFISLSQRFPDNTITVTYADEDIGSNCGSFSVLNGGVIEEDVAPPWGEMDDEQKAKWESFACQVTGREFSTDEE